MELVELLEQAHEYLLSQIVCVGLAHHAIHQPIYLIAMLHVELLLGIALASHTSLQQLTFVSGQGAEIRLDVRSGCVGRRFRRFQASTMDSKIG